MAVQTDRHPDRAGSIPLNDDALDTIDGASTAGVGRRWYPFRPREDASGGGSRGLINR
jgi:hypothetical protein